MVKYHVIQDFIALLHGENGFFILRCFTAISKSDEISDLQINFLWSFYSEIFRKLTTQAKKKTMFETLNSRVGITSLNLHTKLNVLGENE